MSRHNLRATRATASFLENLVQDSFLLYTVDFIWRLWSSKKVGLLLAYQAVMRGLRELVMVLTDAVAASIVDLLQ